MFRRRSATPTLTGEPSLSHPVSQACTAAQFDEPAYARWCAAIGEPPRLHRKQWEFCYILQALETRGMLRPGKRGLGFGVGHEPLVAAMAQRGCEITATDLPADAARAAFWIDTDQHASGLAALNDRGLCPPADFAARVRWEPADMRAVPEHLAGYDFTWSACAFEHLGSLVAGIDFVLASLRCLKPGGVAVHTTEYSIHDRWRTRARGATVVYRRRDLEGLFARAATAGFTTAANWSAGTRPLDEYVDLPPYSPDRHVKLAYRGLTVTSFGLVLASELG
jgi:2-polyprenyl-3-methyl-5-hydroxy-6-metoxy-1,4-benzoquinol methylase